VRAGTAHVDLSERRHDLRHDVPVPFATDPTAGYGVDPVDTVAAAGRADLGTVVNSRAIQCALSRVCGLCGLSLSGPPTFVGSAAEADTNTFRFPPMHRDCADYALRTFTGLGVPVLGQQIVLTGWELVVTGGFELERPTRRGPDMHVCFHPNSVVERRTVSIG